MFFLKLPNKGMGREVLLKEVDKYENMGNEIHLHLFISNFTVFIVKTFAQIYGIHDSFHKATFPFWILKFTGKINWKAGRVSGTVYHGGKELTDVLSEVCTYTLHKILPSHFLISWISGVFLICLNRVNFMLVHLVQTQILTIFLGL